MWSERYTKWKERDQRQQQQKLQSLWPSERHRSWLQLVSLLELEMAPEIEVDPDAESMLLS